MKQIIILFSCLSILTSCGINPQIETKNFTQEQIDSLKILECDILLKEIHALQADTFSSLKQIPKDFEESLIFLDSMTNPQMKRWIKCLPDGEFNHYVHHRFGMHLRNNWGLWSNSILSENLYKMGILHPDDMSSIILDSYQRKLKGENIKIDDQLKYYQDYWRKTGTPVDSILNELKKIPN